MRAAAVVLALLAVAPEAPGDGEDPEVAPYPLVVRTDDRPDVVATTVVDARTGRVVVGATVRGYAEEVTGRAAMVNALVCEMTTDEHGIASARLDTKALGCSHWVVAAKGYRPYADYHGYWPPERVVLDPGTPMVVRLVNGMGWPAAHATVEAFSGCPHAPPAARGVTDAEGVFRVEHGSSDGYELWAEAEGCGLPDPAQLLPAFGDSVPVEVLPMGIAVTGRVTALDGRPIHGAVVRTAGYPRGPATLTDAEGRFLLKGHPLKEALRVVHPTLSGDPDAAKGQFVARAVSDVPLDLVWTLDGFLDADATGTLAIRALDAKGAPGADLHLLLIGPDGRGREAVTNGDGEASVTVPCGAWRVRGDNPFEAYQVAEATAVVREDEEAAVALALRPRPRLRIDGEIPPDLAVSLEAAGRVCGARLVPTKDGPAEPVWLPERALAVLQVADWTATGWRHFVEVGPAAEGARTAVVRLPPAHRVRVASDETLDGETLFVSPASDLRILRPFQVVKGALSFRCGGSFVLHLEGEEEEILLPFELPPLSAGAVERTALPNPSLGLADPRGTATLFVTLADGSPLREIAVQGDDHSSSGGDSPVEVWAPAWVLLSPEGVQPMHLWVPKAGEQKVLFPVEGIDLTTVDAAGAPVAASVLIEGVAHAAPDGHLRLRGLAPGPHAVVVQRVSWPPRVPGALLWRFTLASGELRAKTLTLP